MVGLYNILTERFNINEVTDLVTDLNLEWNYDLSGTKPAQKIRDLIRIMELDKTTDVLLDHISNYRKNDLDLYQYLYLVIAESFDKKDIVKLYILNEIVISANDLKHYSDNLDSRRIIAKNIQTVMEESGKSNLLLETILKIKPNLVLDWYVL